MAVLSEAQRAQYENDGYLVVSGLIPAEAITAARLLVAEQAHQGKTFAGVSGPEIAACYNNAIVGAASEVGGADEKPYTATDSALAIVVPPSDGEWQWPHPHIDHALERDNFRVFPRCMRVASMLYLSDVAPHGGGTVVWPGSHKKIEVLARSDPEKYARMFHLNQDLKQLDLGEPVELTPSASDILFYHYLCAHAGSKNINPQPRLAMNHKW